MPAAVLSTLGTTRRIGQHGIDTFAARAACRELRRHRFGPGSLMLLHGATMSRSDFEAGTGWTLSAEGACRGDVCIPLRIPIGETVDVAAVAEQIGLPLVHDADHGISALGPWPGTGHALVTAEAPELALPDIDGTEFRLSSLRGQKVLILSWAPY